MRRARIKAVATVPIRRKVTQDNPTTEHTAQTDSKEHDKSLEKNVVKSDTNSTSIAIKECEVETIKAPIVPQKVSDTSTAVKEHLQTNEEFIISSTKERNLENTVNDSVNQVDIKKYAQPIIRTESLQKIPVTECFSTKTIQSRSCFMRPTPRLDGSGRIRRNSIQGSGASASESEDDSRRSCSIGPHRARNDSLCSMQSLKDGNNTSNIAKLNVYQKRRMVVSESARKLAEARREFLIKHENKSPDKSKLTMYDLIYYNPTTNPMKPKLPTRSSNRKVSVCSLNPKNKDEGVVDESIEMLVPQVKVGPNGQLVIDEQSLVIDQYKAQENIDRSDIIIDEDTTGNGFYKKRQKSKEWSKWETVKFYKALNTYGTDFLLMQSIFPKRTRIELKLKYKKEERLNRNLVEKALQYQEFDTEALEKDLANVEENERKECELSQTKKIIRKRKRRRCQIISQAINCSNDEQNSECNKNSCNEQSSDENARITITRKIRKRAIRKYKGLKKYNDDCSESLEDNSESEPEIYETQHTRSGRVSRKIKKTNKATKDLEYKNKEQTESTEQINNEIISVVVDNEKLEVSKPQNEGEPKNQNNFPEFKEGTSTCRSSNVFKDIPSDISNLPNLQPGSLVVLKKDSIDEPGKTLLEVFIVSSDYDVNNPNCKDNLLPVDLSSDMLKTVENRIKDIQPESTPQESNKV